MSTQQYILPQEEPMPGLEGVRLLYVTRTQYSPEWNSEPHVHACAELFFVLGGVGSLQLQQDMVPLTAGDLVVVNPGVPHTERSQEQEPLQYVVLGVDGLELHAGPGGYILLHGSAQQPNAWSYWCRRRRPGTAPARQPVRACCGCCSSS